MSKQTICIGMAGAGRATELHMEAYAYVRGINLRYKKIIARRKERAIAGKERYGFEIAADSFEELVNDDEIDVIDICTPPYVHVEMIEQALLAGKYVICEKPLTGYFGEDGDGELVGKNVTRAQMYAKVLENMEQLKKIVEKYPNRFFYAENFVYAPAIQRMAEMIRKKQSRILCMKGEESLKGSSSPVAGYWNRNGGGTFMRTGTHPLSAILWLKHVEAEARGCEIKPESIIADMGHITESLTEYEHRHIAARPVDVEDYGTASITFSDGTKAIVTATDTLVGGSRNYVEAYCNDAVLYANLTLTDLMSSYFLDEERLDDVYISEMLPSKTGWNHPFVADGIIRGYVAEIQDFMECIIHDRKPLAGFGLAYDTVKVIYAAYLSAEEERKIKL